MRTLHTTDKIRFYFAANEGAKNQMQLSAKCQCGKVEFKASGPPILTTACYCTDCQTAGRQFEQLPSAPPMLDPDSGTGMILYRKDRVQCAKGQEFLEERRLKPTSPTRRVVATCCNSAMFLDFTKGHWLSMFRNRFGAGAPPLEMRVMTKERRAGVALADDVPNYPGRSGKFMRKLLTSWAAMGFRRPEIPWGKPVQRVQRNAPSRSACLFWKIAYNAILTEHNLDRGIDE